MKQSLDDVVALKRAKHTQSRHVAALESSQHWRQRLKRRYATHITGASRPVAVSSLYSSDLVTVTSLHNST